MQIPKNLPQFKDYPTLFVSSGEYEARFYLALDGKLEEKNTIKMPPREEAREKQGFIGISWGQARVGALSHHGQYIADLKRKFARRAHTAIHDLLAGYRIREIYLFAPRYVAERLTAKLDKAEKKKIKMKFPGEYTKISPLEMIKMFWKDSQAAVNPKEPLKNEVKKILKKLRIR
ncbi:MAG: hypothetical protein NT136_01790 [Candidatus Moranbacteria bacterium]|nr:hypothetical protein [Candidatus Moranbacteria bacterium]